MAVIQLFDTTPKLGKAGRAILKHKEGLRLKAYRDMGSYGAWTIGYGHTATAEPGMVITEEQAEELLTSDLLRFERAYARLVTAPLPPLARDAVILFMFNLGEGAFTRSTLRSLINRKQWKQAAQEFGKWANARDAKGVLMRVMGLVRRRGLEEGLFVAGLALEDLWDEKSTRG
jgi:lysozyme